jgi:DNA-binding MarR family transcriptional regulator
MAGKPREHAFARRVATVAGLSRLLDLALDEVDLTVAQYRILTFCALGDTTPSDVTRWLSERRSSASRQIQLLVLRELLERQPDVHDGRRVVLTVTPHGRAQLREADRAIDCYLDALLSLLPEARSSSANLGLEAFGEALALGWARASETPLPALSGWYVPRA